MWVFFHVFSHRSATNVDIIMFGHACQYNYVRPNVRICLFVSNVLYYSFMQIDVGLRQSIELYGTTVEPLLYDHPQNHIGVVV